MGQYTPATDGHLVYRCVAKTLHSEERCGSERHVYSKGGKRKRCIVYEIGSHFQNHDPVPKGHYRWSDPQVDHLEKRYLENAIPKEMWRSLCDVGLQDGATSQMLRGWKKRRSRKKELTSEPKPDGLESLREEISEVVSFSDWDGEDHDQVFRCSLVDGGPHVRTGDDVPDPGSTMVTTTGVRLVLRAPHHL